MGKMHEERGLPPWVKDAGEIIMARIEPKLVEPPKPIYEDGLYAYRPKADEPWVSHYYNSGRDICNAKGQLMDDAYSVTADGLPKEGGGYQTVSFDWYCRGAYSRGTEINGRWAPRAQAAGCAVSMLMVALMGLALLL